jgi:GNAT superfamily N-acetyltransferase
MEKYYGKYLISDDKNCIQNNCVYDMLINTYWANNRSKEVIEKSIVNSLCFGVYIDNKQIGFARCVTDYSVLYYLCDVVIEKAYRGQGLGKQLIQFITEHEKMKSLIGLLGTNDAHKLYEKFGFMLNQKNSMYRYPKQ